MSQLFDFPNAQLLPAQCQHEFFDLVLGHAVHAHELPQSVHVRVDRKGPTEDLLPDCLGHLCYEPQPHADPGLAPQKLFCDFGHAHMMKILEVVDKPRLFENAQRFVVGNSQNTHDAYRLVLSQRRIRHRLDSKLACASITLETV